MDSQKLRHIPNAYQIFFFLSFTAYYFNLLNRSNTPGLNTGVVKGFPEEMLLIQNVLALEPM